MKTIFTYLLVTLLLALPLAVQAQFNYTINNGAITITDYNASAGLNVVIPSSINGYPVVSIGDSAFYGSSITSVTIPNSVTSIAVNAFDNCTKLTSVTIPNSVTNIGISAFAYCTKLTSVTIGNSVSSIGTYAFGNCTNLTSVTIPNSVTNIGISAFAYCTSLTSVTIPNSITSIAGSAFANCTKLTSVTIPNSVTSIGDSAFYGSSITSVTIPNSVTSIAVNAFDNCTSLTSIAVDAANLTYSSSNGVLFDKNQTTLIEFPGGLSGNYNIPNSVSSIGDSAFYGSSITSVTIPNSVTSIGTYAFGNCTSLTSVTIPNSVTSIAGNAFYYCTSLKSVTIPNSITSIGYSAFFYCTNLTSATIPNSVTIIGYNAFGYCYSLTSAYFLGNAPSMTNAFLGQSSTTLYYSAGTTGWGSNNSGAGGTTPIYPPQIVSSPVTVFTNAASPAAFSVTALGAMPLAYQWRINGTNLLKATNSILNIASLNKTNAGQYTVVITNSYGSVTSSVAGLYLLPSITQPFAGLVANAGQPATLSVTASSVVPLTYQWYFNGSAIAGATNTTLSLGTIQSTNAGLYNVVVSSSLGNITNTPYLVVVNAAGVSQGIFAGVGFQGVAGTNYSVVVATNLAKGWTTLGSLTASGSAQVWDDNSVDTHGAGNQGKFYAVTTASSAARASNMALGFYNGVIIQGTVGVTYIIRSTTDLSNTNAWVTQTNLTLGAATQIWDDNSVDVSKRGHATVYYSVQTGP